MCLFYSPCFIFCLIHFIYSIGPTHPAELQVHLLSPKLTPDNIFQLMYHPTGTIYYPTTLFETLVAKLINIFISFYLLS